MSTHKKWIQTCIAGLLLALICELAFPMPKTFTQINHSDGTVTTTLNEEGVVIHDASREGGKLTKEDLLRQGWTHLTSSAYKYRINDSSESLDPIDEVFELSDDHSRSDCKRTGFRCENSWADGPMVQDRAHQ